MTRVAYFDLIGGVAGDMLLAALIDAGADTDEVFRSLATLPLEHRNPHVEEVSRGGIRALHLTGTPRTGQRPRTLDEVLWIVRAGALPDAVAERAAAVFVRLAAAEASAHGSSPPVVHLHEVGDDDAIFDVVGVLVALETLGIDEVRSSPVPLGGGRAASGLSWPGPATLALLTGVPVTGPPPGQEATTPTGAALIASVVTSFGGPPSMTLSHVGYGAGTRDVPDHPNLLRVLIGEIDKPPWSSERTMRVVETNVDDLSPQLVADAVRAIFDSGAVDVWVTPIQMKRGRLAVTISALCDQTVLVGVKETFFRATTTLGVRDYPVERAVLERETDSVDLRGGSVRIKRGRLRGTVITSMAEHSDLERLSRDTGIPIRQLSEEAAALARGSPESPEPAGD
ncbi:MAG TPA: nickel pincer cofactor biosynthesis protein LarC [Patescibacteria group bacterium]|nr:nickel pincer cofactor biosynthesis protein LarC [Patescibacteria group bacterium]